MRFPEFMKKFNNVTGSISGALILIIGCLAVIEAFMRGVFSKPTTWSMDISQYVLIWAIFLGSSYSFQEKGHVSVDFLKERFEKWFGNRTRRIMAIIGYVFALMVIFVIAEGSIDMIIDAVNYQKLTVAMIQIPLVYLLIPMLIGSILMAVTVIFIILDLIGKGDTYI